MNINPKVAIERGWLKTCKHTQVQQVGIDLTIEEAVTIEHGESKNVYLNEVIELPDNVFALVVQRSTFNRLGVMIRGCVFDPGFHGKAGVTIYNMSGDRFSIRKNQRLLQILFFNADAASTYNGQYQHDRIVAP